MAKPLHPRLRKRYRLKLKKRDGDLCAICGQKMCFDYARNTEIPGEPRRPDMASIDHIKPISRGGGHAFNNLRLACHGCNSARGNDL